jgi:hypothetical protein
MVSKETETCRGEFQVFYYEILVFQSVVKCMSWNNKEEIEHNLVNTFILKVVSLVTCVPCVIPVLVTSVIMQVSYHCVCVIVVTA